jgi:phosphatidate cytidylyltransferase
MRQRILSTLTLWTIVFLCMYFLGATGAIWLVAAMGVLTLHEYFAMLPRVGLAPFRRLGLVFAAAILLAPRYLEPYGIRAEWLLALSVIVLRCASSRSATRKPMETLAWSTFGMIYIPFMLHFSCAS